MPQLKEENTLGVVLDKNDDFDTKYVDIEQVSFNNTDHLSIQSDTDSEVDAALSDSESDISRSELPKKDCCTGEDDK